jgi:hypothetical protein
MKPNVVTKDAFPRLYLGVALSRSRDNNDEALKVLTQALDSADQAPGLYVKNALWARAELSRPLRRIGWQTEAEGCEDKTRQVMSIGVSENVRLNDAVLDPGFWDSGTPIHNSAHRAEGPSLGRYNPKQYQPFFHPQ